MVRWKSFLLVVPITEFLRPCGTAGFSLFGNPPLKRWAIVGCPCRDELSGTKIDLCGESQILSFAQLRVGGGSAVARWSRTPLSIDRLLLSR
jgi:hypothetical protein